MAMAQGNIFRGGVPIDPDVRKLVDKFGVPMIGARITYEEISACLDGLSWRTKRWKAITEKWRKGLDRDHNLITEAEPGTAFIVADSSSRVVITSKTLVRGTRTIKKAHKIGVRTPRTGLSTEESRVLDHKIHTSATMIQVARTAPKALGQLPTLDVAQRKRTPRP
jgi:hypothetical protein